MFTRVLNVVIEHLSLASGELIGNASGNLLDPRSSKEETVAFVSVN